MPQQSTCRIRVCERRPISRGWCTSHATIEDRYWAKVARRGNDECWEWTGGKDSGAYGMLVIAAPTPSGRTMLRASHVALLLDGTSVPEGFMACHRCDNPPCVNPAHLYVGDQDSNMQDKKERGRIAVARGSENGISKLTEDDVRDLRTRAAAGVSRRILADEYGIDPSNLSYIIRRKTWTHV
jgi:hypothetical protein